MRDKTDNNPNLRCHWCIPGIDNCHCSQEEIKKYYDKQDEKLQTDYKTLYDEMALRLSTLRAFAKFTQPPNIKQQLLDISNGRILYDRKTNSFKKI